MLLFSIHKGQKRKKKKEKRPAELAALFMHLHSSAFNCK
jgi:hypothetical protein